MTGNNSKETTKLYTTGILPTFTFVVDGPDGTISKNDNHHGPTKTRSLEQSTGHKDKSQHFIEGMDLETTTARVVPSGPLHIVPSWQPLDANDKPPYSYATLIAHAILSSEERRLTLGDIYQWITQHYPFYSMNENGWQNSIRHNLSLNKAFVRIQRSMAMNSGKGSFWTIRPGQELGFIDKLIKRRGPIRKQLVNLPRPLHYSRSSPRLGSYFASSPCQPVNTSPLFTTFRMTPTPERSRTKTERSTKRKRSMPVLHQRQNEHYDEYAHDSDCDSGIDVGHEYTKPNKQQQLAPQLKKAKSSPCLSLDHSINDEATTAFQNLLPFNYMDPNLNGVNPWDTVDMSSSLLPFIDWSDLSLQQPTDLMALPFPCIDPPTIVDEPYSDMTPENLMTISSSLELLPFNDYLSDESLLMADWIV